MRLRSFVMVAAAVLLLGGGTALAQTGGAPYVFVSNPAAGQIVKVTSDTDYTVIFEQRKLAVQDMVVGPDDLLYACAPDAGLVFRFDPSSPPSGGFPYTRTSVTTVYSGPLHLQCGWFSDKGDFFVTGSNKAVWVFNDLVPLGGSPPSLPMTPDVFVEGTAFNGQGITQAAPGDLLYVSKSAGMVWRLPFDPIFRFAALSSPGPQSIIEGIVSPIGIARSGNNAIFVAAGTAIEAYQYNGCLKDWEYLFSIAGFNGQSPQFLQFAADDALYVASTSKQAATLWKIDGISIVRDPDNECSFLWDSGDISPIITFERPTWVPGMSGVALPRTSRAGIEPDLLPPGVDPDYYFSFKDHAYEINLDNVSCSTYPTVSAQETQPECLANLINCYIETDDNQTDNPVTGVPVTYAGDGGAAQLYSVEGTCNETVPDAGAIGHAISAYTALVKNPRIVRCAIPDGFDICAEPPSDCTNVVKFCQVITLDSFFPFDGVFPDDGRIEGTRGASDFSEYFFADITLSATGSVDENAPGCFCGWEPPLPDVFMVDPDDPFFGLPSYNSGSSVPLKFRVAALGPDQTCDTFDPCATSPYGYVTGARVLLSVAKVFDGNGDRVFVPIRPESTSASVPGTIFGNPSSPSTPYHYNLDTSGYLPGVYQAVAVALTDNFTVDWTYFAIH